MQIRNQNNYSFSNLLKAGVVFISTSMSYGLLSSSSWVLVAGDGQDSITRKRVAQQFVNGQTDLFNLALIDNSHGFTVPGLSAYVSLSREGDINGDGFADLILGDSPVSINGSFASGAVYVIFGKANGWSSSFNLSTLNGTNGFVIPGLNSNDQIGTSVSILEDINGDGIDDLAISANLISNTGVVYVIFGKSSAWSTYFNLSTLNGNNGFTIPGPNTNSFFGRSVSTAGNFNGDSYADIIIGTHRSTGGLMDAGTVYVIFGQATGWSPIVNVVSLNGTNGFVIPGLRANDGLGYSVSTAEDFNGDGIDDLLLGALNASPGGPAQATGTVYVIFGQTTAWPANFNLNALNGSNGFAISGLSFSNYLGVSLSAAGDFNGDGFDDIVLGCENSPYIAFLVFGRATGWSASFNLTMLNGSNGFAVPRLLPITLVGSSIGSSVSTAGDFNGDGFADVLIGDDGSSPDGLIGSGTVYLIYGKADGWSASFDCTTLNGTNGFAIPGRDVSSRLGALVSTAGDINRDGFSDIVLGRSSPTYIIFGNNVSNLIALATNQLTLIQNQTVTLTTSDLSVRYVRGNSSSLFYSVSNAQAGYFQLLTNPRLAISAFTQIELNNQLIQFVHDGSNNTPSYRVSASVGIWKTPAMIANVSFARGFPPVLVNYSFSLTRGASVVLTSSMLSAYNPNSYGNSNETLIFRIFNLMHGQIELATNPRVPVLQFFQQQILSGNVIFTHDDTVFAPQANVQVTNSFGLNSSIAAIAIRFDNRTNNPNAPSDANTNQELIGAIGGGAVSGAIALGGLIGITVWARKRAQDKNTRKYHRFANHIRVALNLRGLDNFEGEKGQRYVAIVQRLENEFSTQGGMTLNTMSDDELKVLAKQVANSARNKITSSTTLLGYSIITVEQLDEKIPAITQDVLKIRVDGTDGNSILMTSL